VLAGEGLDGNNDLREKDHRPVSPSACVPASDVACTLRAVQSDVRGVAYDCLRACRAGARQTVDTFRSLRRNRGEPSAFSRAWDANRFR
jgi:hypothetical protein